MNHTIASCGHPVIAVGSPGSDARRACEQNPCGKPKCAAAAIVQILAGCGDVKAALSIVDDEYCLKCNNHQDKCDCDPYEGMRGDDL